MNPDLVVRHKEGKTYSVRYDQVNAMLLNEFLKAHRRLEQQEATIAGLQQQIEALTAGLQKVSAQLQASKPTAQVVPKGSVGYAGAPQLRHCGLASFLLSGNCGGYPADSPNSKAYSNRSCTN